MKSGKRNAEEVIEEQTVENKQQKIVNADMEQVTEENKFEMEANSVMEQGAEENNIGMQTQNNFKQDQANSSDENAFSRSEEEKNKVEDSLAINSVTTQDAKRCSSSCESGKEDADDNSEIDEHPETPNESLQSPTSSPATGSKFVLMDNLSFSIKEADVRTFFQNVGEIAEVHFEMKNNYFTARGHIEFTTAEAAQEALKLNNQLLLEQPVRLNLATERVDPLATTDSSGSKTLYLGNLSFSVEEDDVRDFFKNVGEIAEIRFVIRDDRFLGYGYIEFTTAEAAQEALKLNNEIILDRPVKLDLARPRERGAYTPINRTEKFNQKGGRTYGKTIFVRGFDPNDGFDNIRSALEKHFGKCGEISRMAIPKDYESGSPRGVAFIDFADYSGFSQALRLDGSEVGGNRITVEKAKNQSLDSHEGSAHSSNRGFGGNRSSSGSGGSWHRESGHGGGGWHSRGSGYGGGWHGESGSNNRFSGPSHRESGSSRYLGRDVGWHGESGSNNSFSGSSHRESGSSHYLGSESGSRHDVRRESGFGRGGSRGNESRGGGGRIGSRGGWYRGGGSIGGWNRETGFGGSRFRSFSSGFVGRFSGRS